MSPQKSGYADIIHILLQEKDRAGLSALLRQPQQPELRAQAALALSELGDFDLTELLVRAAHEDPEAAVRAAAHQALTALFGSTANSVMASYPGSGAADPWLQEAPEDITDDLEMNEDELEGFVRIARSEGNVRLRLQAIRVLGHSLSPNITDTLVNLVLYGGESAVCAAARQALESLHGERASEIIENYRSAALEEARADGTEDQLLEEMDLGEEADPAEDETEPAAQAARPASPYTAAAAEPVTQELGLPLWLLWVGLILAGLAGLIWWLGQ